MPFFHVQLLFIFAILVGISLGVRNFFFNTKCVPWTLGAMFTHTKCLLDFFLLSTFVHIPLLMVPSI